MTYGYDARGRVTSLSNQSQEYDADEDLLYNTDTYTIGYDAAGNKTSIVASIPQADGAPDGSRTQTFSYDARDELTADDSSYTYANNYNNQYAFGFAYDAAYNATEFRSTSGIGFTADNQYTASDLGTSFAYDGDGNSTTYQNTGFSFDAENRLTAISSKSFAASYSGDDTRATKTVGSSPESYYVYDEASGAPMPLLEENQSGTTTSILNAYGSGADGFRQRYLQGSPAYYAYSFDPMGNVARRDSSAQADRVLNYN